MWLWPMSICRGRKRNPLTRTAIKVGSTPRLQKQVDWSNQLVQYREFDNAWASPRRSRSSRRSSWNAGRAWTPCREIPPRPNTARRLSPTGMNWPAWRSRSAAGPAKMRELAGRTKCMKSDTNWPKRMRFGPCQWEQPGAADRSPLGPKRTDRVVPNPNRVLQPRHGELVRPGPDLGRSPIRIRPGPGSQEFRLAQDAVASHAKDLDQLQTLADQTRDRRGRIAADVEFIAGLKAERELVALRNSLSDPFRSEAR